MEISRRSGELSQTKDHGVENARLQVSANLDELFYRSQGVAGDRDSLIDHYLFEGWTQNLDPAPWFSTERYLAENEDVRAAELNPLVHYCIFGASEGRSAPPSLKDVIIKDSDPVSMTRRYIDREFYVAQIGDLDLSGKSVAEHFDEIGWVQGLDPSPDFSTTSYLEAYADVKAAGINPLLHYVLYGQSEGRSTFQSSALTKVDDSDLQLLNSAIDVEYYTRQLSQVDFTKISPGKHYATIGWKLGLNPTPHFSSKEYLELHPDVKGAGVNPFLHYLLQGEAEGRALSTRRSLSDGSSEWIGYSHVRDKGYSGKPYVPAIDILRFCASLKGCDLVAAVESMWFGAARDDVDPEIIVSIIIPCVNEELVTAECLASIDAHKPLDYQVEVIIADNASTDRLYKSLKSNSSLKVVRFDQNVGFGPACNAAAKEAQGKYVFFLNNDAQIAPGCIEALLEGIKSKRGESPVGMVGPKILSFDGTLQEAGCWLASDGTGNLIGFGMDPSTPRFNYDRPVQHLSGAAILLERQLFLDLGGFDDVFAPAYCEDADLSLKVWKRGLEVRYVSNALVAHHLSKTSNSDTSKDTKKQRISKNRSTLVKRWSSELATQDLRTIAFYLPQYHPVKENDRWWGKGFTEWRNATNATQNYVGHNQPRYPADLGYYDLRVADVMEQQADLAKKYGITGFCYYYYWFGGKKLLETPVERLLETGRPDLPFCLCWANENWTRRWDGMANDVLIEQSYSDDDSLALISDLARFFHMPNYIKIKGRPLILIYRVKELPNPVRALQIWRNYCRAAGIGEICIVSVESFELSACPEDPGNFGCDLSVEFPPHGMVHDEPIPVKRLNNDWTGSVHDYRELCRSYMTREEAGFKRLRSVLVGWDNSPRHQNRSLILDNATPGAFQAWLEWTYRRTLEQNHGDERIVFVNAWNEWCEGSYLEPDRQFGHAYLQAVRNALENVSTGGDTFVETR